MGTLLVVLMMAFNMWVVIYLCRERREERKGTVTDDGNGGVTGNPATEDIVGRSGFRMPGRKPQAATTAPNAATEAHSGEVEVKDVTFADEMPEETYAGHPPHQLPDRTLDEVFSDNRVSAAGAGYGPDNDYDGSPQEASGFSFEDIDRAVRTVKDDGATPAERLHAGKVFTGMEGNELFALIEKSSEDSRRKLDELMDYYQNAALSAVRREPSPEGGGSGFPPLPESYEDFNIRDYV